MSPSPPALNSSQHQGLFQWVSCHQLAKVLGASASASVFPMNIQGWFPLGLTGLISFLSKGLSRVFFLTTAQKHHFFGAQPSLWSLTSTHDYWKNHSFVYMDLCQQSDDSTFQYAVKFCDSFSSKELMSLNFVAAVTVHSNFGAQENEVSLFPFFPIYLSGSDGTRCHDLQFLSFKLAFSFFFLFVVNFVIHWNETAMGIHVFPILIPPPTSFPIPSLRVIPVHQPWAPYPMHRTWAGDLFHIW